MNKAIVSDYLLSKSKTYNKIASSCLDRFISNFCLEINFSSGEVKTFFKHHVVRLSERNLLWILSFAFLKRALFSA